ncbi:MAG TPA: hypothetical protein VGR37_16635 [Longimicrobiaceae bacterium]|nr:hypothetical protein [Longimicrobiaceae bacterium]
MRLLQPASLGGLAALLLLGGWAVPGTEAKVETERYLLVQVDGRPLPFLIYAVDDDCEVDLVGGTLDLEPARGRYVLVDRVRGQCAWTAPDEVEERESGRYEADALEMRFRSDGSSRTWPGWARGDTIRMVRGGRAYTFRR